MSSSSSPMIAVFGHKQRAVMFVCIVVGGDGGWRKNVGIEERKIYRTKLKLFHTAQNSFMKRNDVHKRCVASLAGQCSIVTKGSSFTRDE